MLCHANNLVTKPLSWSATLGILPSERAYNPRTARHASHVTESPKQRVQCKGTLPALLFFNWPHIFLPFAS